MDREPTVQLAQFTIPGLTLSVFSNQGPRA